MPRSRSLATAFLVPAGALIGHALAYSLGSGPAPSNPAHDHLPALAGLAGPLAMVALVWFGRQGARGAGAPGLRLLVVVQPLVFVAQEGVEHALGGHGLETLAHSPVLRVGVVAQVLVAALVILLVSAARVTGRAIAAALRSRREPRLRRDLRARPATPGCSYCTPVGMPTSQRGPPDLLATT